MLHDLLLDIPTTIEPLYCLIHHMGRSNVVRHVEWNGKHIPFEHNENPTELLEMFSKKITNAIKDLEDALDNSIGNFNYSGIKYHSHNLLEQFPKYNAYIRTDAIIQMMYNIINNLDESATSTNAHNLEDIGLSTSLAYKINDELAGLIDVYGVSKCYTTPADYLREISMFIDTIMEHDKRFYVPAITMVRETILFVNYMIKNMIGEGARLAYDRRNTIADSYLTEPRVRNNREALAVVDAFKKFDDMATNHNADWCYVDFTYEILLIKFIHFCQQKPKIRLCESCGKPFIPVTYNNKYCNCISTPPTLKTKIDKINNPSYRCIEINAEREYTRIYNLLHARMRRVKEKGGEAYAKAKLQYEQWKTEAYTTRSMYRMGSISDESAVESYREAFDKYCK